MECKVLWMTHGNLTWQEFRYSHIERNDRFINIIKTFMNADFKDLDVRLSTVNSAIKSLNMVINVKKSNIENKFIEL